MIQKKNITTVKYMDKTMIWSVYVKNILAESILIRVCELCKWEIYFLKVKMITLFLLVSMLGTNSIYIIIFLQMNKIG